MTEDKDLTGYLKFIGPSVNDGQIDARKAGKALIALQKSFEIYQKEEKKKRDSKSKGKKNKSKELPLTIKLGGVRKNCTELLFGIGTVSGVALVVNKVLKDVGVYEFSKAWFKTMGEQMALRKFEKGTEAQVTKEYAKDGQVYVLIVNSDKELKKLPKNDWQYRRLLAEPLSELGELEEGGAEKLKFGFYENKAPQDVGEVSYQESEFFNYERDKNYDERLKEDFEDDKAEPDNKIVGQFVDYYDLASKYHFAFQARKNIETVGKKKILCVVPEENFSMILDEFKKTKKDRKNLCLSGSIIRDADGRVDKIKVDWISTNENYDPSQLSLNP